MMIVVTVPTGQIGRHVVRRLLAEGLPMRLVVRDASRLEDDVRAKVEIVEGSHGDPTIVDKALEGAESLFWIVPPDFGRTMTEAFLDFTRPATEAIRRHRVRRVVSVTALGRGTPWEHTAGVVTASIAMEDMLMATGAAYRGLACPSFMDNLIRQVGPIRERGVMFGPIDPDLKAPTTATRDIGAVASRLLATDDWTGQEEVAVLGPENLSFNDMAATISDALGRDVRYKQIPLGEFRNMLLARGATESVAQGYVDMMRAKNEGIDDVAETTPSVRTATSFRQWFEDEMRGAIE